MRPPAVNVIAAGRRAHERSRRRASAPRGTSLLRRPSWPARTGFRPIRPPAAGDLARRAWAPSCGLWASGRRRGGGAARRAVCCLIAPRRLREDGLREPLARAGGLVETIGCLLQESADPGEDPELSGEGEGHDGKGDGVGRSLQGGDDVGTGSEGIEGLTSLGRVFPGGSGGRRHLAVAVAGGCCVRRSGRSTGVPPPSGGSEFQTARKPLRTPRCPRPTRSLQQRPRTWPCQLSGWHRFSPPCLRGSCPQRPTRMYAQVFNRLTTTRSSVPAAFPVGRS